MELNVQMGGRFKLLSRNPDGQIKQLTDWFDNIITNDGLDRKGEFSDFMDVCQVGFGFTFPIETNTSLDNMIAAVSWDSSMGFSDGTNVVNEPFYGRARRTYIFPSGAAQGQLSEVGISWNTSASGPLFSRALILDELGQPTEVTVLSDEELIVLYELRLYRPSGDVVQEIEDSSTGITHTLTIRPSRINRTVNQTNSFNDLSGWGGLPVTTAAISSSGGSQRPEVYNGTIGSETSFPSGDSNNSNSTENEPYVMGSYERTVTVGWNANNGNLTNGISALRIPTGIGEFQIQFDPPFDKTDTEIFDISFNLIWGRRND
jgi:hypothetical protein